VPDVYPMGAKIVPRVAQKALAAARAPDGSQDPDILSMLWNEQRVDLTLRAVDGPSEDKPLGRQGLMLGGILIGADSSQRLCRLLDAAPDVGAEIAICDGTTGLARRLARCSQT